MFGTLDVCLVPTQKLFSFRVWLLIGTWIRADLNLWYPPQESFTLTTVLWMGCVGGGLWGFGSASENKILKQKHLFFKKKTKTFHFSLRLLVGNWLKADSNLWHAPPKSVTLITVLWKSGAGAETLDFCPSSTKKLEQRLSERLWGQVGL